MATLFSCLVFIFLPVTASRHFHLPRSSWWMSFVCCHPLFLPKHPQFEKKSLTVTFLWLQKEGKMNACISSSTPNHEFYTEVWRAKQQGRFIMREFHNCLALLYCLPLAQSSVKRFRFQAFEFGATGPVIPGAQPSLESLCSRCFLKASMPERFGFDWQEDCNPKPPASTSFIRLPLGAWMNRDQFGQCH